MNRKKICLGYISDGNPNWSADTKGLVYLTHINYAFAVVNEQHEVVENFRRTDELKKITRKFPDIKVCLSIGGWGAGNFSEAAATEEGRVRFADTALSIMQKHGMHGIDLDWEYPTDSGAGISSSPDDKANFTLLLKILREKLDRLDDESGGERSLLTMAAGAAFRHAGYIEWEKACGLMDFVNLMTYDIGSMGEKTAFHANLRPTSRLPEREWSSVGAVEHFVKAGIPLEKLNIGAPFYGRGFTGVGAENSGCDGLNRPVGGERGLYIDYAEIKKLEREGEFRVFYDEEAETPYMYNGDAFYSYETPRSVRARVAFAKERGLGGVFFWEVPLDADGELLTALGEELDN